MDKLKKLMIEYLKITEIQKRNPMCLCVNSRLDRIRRKLEIVKIVPLAEKGEIVFYNFGIGKELRL